MPGRRIEAEALTPETFAPFGTFADLLNPPAEALLERTGPPVAFYPDLVAVGLRIDDLASISVCEVSPRPQQVVDVTEFHEESGEGVLPLNGNVLIHVGHPTADGKPPLDEIRAFLVPQYTQVVLHPGVWHHGPFAIGDSPVSVQIILPPKTYEDDCTDVTLEEPDQIEVVMPGPEGDL